MVLYTCKYCDYTTSIKTHYIRHQSTKKHLRNTSHKDDSILDKILSFSNTRLKRNKKNYTVHYVKYSINDTPYIIDEHQDWCKFTLIVYLDKSPEVSDEFWVNDEKVEENVWVTNDNNYKCLAFWGNAPHRGKVFGKGKRDILCFFSD